MANHTEVTVIMKQGESYWSLSRRGLFKLVPPSVASWLLASPAPGKPLPTPVVFPPARRSAEKRWLGEWIWEPIEVTDPLGSPEGPFFQSSPFRNLFAYLRKSFDAPEGVSRAWAQVSADSRYKLYVNGHYVGRGPARCDPLWQYYDEYDIKPLLRPGRNVIAALVHYYGEKTGWYLPGRPGFIFECSLEHSGGGPTLVKSDTSWKFLRAPMWTQDVPRVSGALGFVEVYDARRDVEGWNLPKFDDSQWQRVEVISRVSQTDIPLRTPFPWQNPVARDIPPLLEKEVRPTKITMIGEVQNLPPGAAPNIAHQMSQEEPGRLKNCSVENADSLTSASSPGVVIRTTPLGAGDSPGQSAVVVLDFGRELTGYPYLDLEGVAGGMVDMGVCESLADGRVTPTRNGLHCNRYIMKDGPQRWQAFEWVGFRYLQMTVRNCPQPVTIRQAGVNFTSYPVGTSGTFHSSDERLNQIWETCRHTVQLCMHDAYEDCPNREQRQWVGDAYVESKVNHAVFGDAKLTRKYLRQIAQSQRSDGIVQMFWPGDDERGVLNIFDIKDFVLLWISTIWEYYRYTGDLELVRELLPNIVKAVGWFENHVDSQGLLSNIPLWIFGDWAPLDRRDHNTVLNGLFYNVLLESTQMARLLGEEELGRRYSQLANGIKAAMRTRFWDARRGVYVDANIDGTLSPRVSQQSNAVCLLYDVATPEQRPRILSYIFDPARVKSPEKYQSLQEGFDEERDVVQSQPFFMHWVDAALAHIGEYDRMVGLIRDLYGAMLDAGATTIWEVWSPRASLCHGWAATPAYDLTTHILGIRGTKAGFSELVIEPHPAGLEMARGVSPSVRGDVSVSWHSTAGGFQIEGSVPEASTASVLIPPQGGKDARQARLNGQPVWEASRPVGPLVAKAEAGGVRIQLGKGRNYKIEAQY
jgi:hypothetical protein